MTVDLDTLKVSLRIDTDTDDDLLRGYRMAAEQYIKNAVGTDQDGFFVRDDVEPLFDTAVTALVGGYYSFRTSLSLVQSYPVDLATDSIIAQLRGVYGRSEVEAKANGN